MKALGDLIAAIILALALYMLVTGIGWLHL